MAGLVPAIHVLSAASKDVDTRHKAGHDGDGAVRRLRSSPHRDSAHETAVVKSRHGRVRRRSFASRRRPGHPRSFPHYPSWPGEATKLCFAPMSRPSTCFCAASKDVDTRHKAGHDGDGAVRRLRSCSHPFSARMKRRSSNVVVTGRGDEACWRRCPGRGSSWPGLSRPSTCFCAASKDVDTRHKAGHDGDGRCVAYGVLRIVTARMKRRSSNVVMAGRGDEASLRADVPAIHVLFRRERGRGCPAQGRA